MNLFSIIDIIEIRQPLWLLLILIPVVSVIFSFVANRNVLPEAFFEARMRYWYLNQENSQRLLQKKHLFINTLFWLLFSVALAGPEYAKINQQHFFESNTHSVILFDVSSSMNTRDVQPSRLLRAKNELTVFIDKLKPGEKLAIILFSGSSHILFPLTADKKAMHFFVDKIRQNILPVKGTSIDIAFNKAGHLLSETRNSNKQTAIILMSDGDYDNKTKNIIDQIKFKNIVHTVSVGRSINSPVPSANPDKQWLTINGNIITSNTNEKLLRTISQKAGGIHSSITGASFSLNNILQTLSKASSTSDKSRTNTNMIQLYHVFLLFAIMIFFYQRLLFNINSNV